MQLTKILSSLLVAFAFLATSASADTIIVNQFGLTFSPQDVTINTGDTIRWVHNGGDHDTTEGNDGTVDGNEAWFGLLTAGSPTYEVTFDAAFLAAHPRPNNTYDYFCSPHFFQFNMVGTVTVVDPPGVSFCDCSMISACNNGGSAGTGCLNSTGSGAVLSASGSTSAATDDIEFDGTLMPSNKPALLFVGTGQVNGGAGAVFGDGVRCAGGQITRLAVKITDAGGSANWGAGQNAGGHWAAGDTRNFQIWFRDPTNGPCGSGFNVTNGYQVTFN